jgi:hypothetical protein
MSANQPSGTLQWQLDLGGDPAPEFIGLIQIANDQGQPAAPPFDLNQFVASGLATFDQFASQLADGWTVSINANAPLEPSINGRLVFAYTAGVVSGTDGNANVQGGVCGTVFILAGVPLADLVGAFPNADISSTFNGNGTALNGMTSFDGTDTPIVDGEVNGGTTVYAFAVDLGTGVVTAVP